MNGRFIHKPMVLSQVRSTLASSQVKGTKTTSFHTHVWNEAVLVPLALRMERNGLSLFGFAYETKRS